MFGILGLRKRRDAPDASVRALILGGGGARGAYEAGVVTALTERESFDVICGTSIGAINGIFVAQDAPERLYEIWRTISSRRVTELKPELALLVVLWQATHGVLSSPLAQKAAHILTMMRTLPHLGAAGTLPQLLGLFESGNARSVIEEMANFEALRRTFIVGVTNLNRQRGEAFAYFPPGLADVEAAFHRREPAETIRCDNYVDAICASAALPPVYEPVAVRCDDGLTRLFADGGFTNNTPLRQAIDAGATDITVILVGPPESRVEERPVSSMVEVANVMLDANTERMLELDLKLARRINADVLAGTAREKRYVSIRIIGPSHPISLPTLGFDEQDEVDRLFAMGYADGRTVVAA